MRQTSTVTYSSRPAAAGSRAVSWLDAGGAWLVLGAGLVIDAALGLWLTRGTTFFVDEKLLFVTDHGFRPSSLLAPLNGHLFLLERLMYAVDWRLFDPSSPVPRVVEIIGVLLVVGLFFVLLKRRVGAAAALPVALLVLFFGSAWENDVVPSGIATVYCVAAGLGALLALEPRTYSPAAHPPEQRVRREDLAASALLLVSVSAWTLGVAFAVGVLVLILLQPGSRRRVWVALVPLLLYAAWLAWVRVSYVPGHGEVQSLTATNILLVPNYLADEASSVMGALAGLNYPFQTQTVFSAFSTTSEFGALLAAAAAAALVVRLRRGSASPLLWTLITILLAFWVALGLGFGPGRSPGTVRYTYEGGILVLLIAAEAARRVRLSPSALAVLYLVCTLALGVNLARLRQGMDFYRPLATSLRARLTALEVARHDVQPNFFLQPPPSFEAVQAGPYLAAVDRLGSPAYAVPELESQSEPLRNIADSELVRLLSMAIAPHPAGEAVHDCVPVTAGARAAVSLPLGSPGATIRSPTASSVAVRRFASVLTVPVGAVPARRQVDLRIPSDGLTRPWQVTIYPAPSGVAVCPLAGGP